MNKLHMKRWLGLPGLMAALLVVAGCSLAPTYEKPDVHAPSAYKETPQRTSDTSALAPSETGTWKTAQPSEEMMRGEWWTLFDDPALNDLERQAQEANQNLKAAAARVKEARAINQTARAGLFPTLDAGFGPTREKFSPASQFLPADANVPAQTLWRAQASALYEVDLFGRVSDSVKAANADTQQGEALFRSVQLALQADVAQNYFNLRELDAENDVFTRTVTLREQALKLVQRRFDEGDISELDVARAKSELATARSDAMTVQRLRASSEHSLAVLLGKTPAEFSVAANPLKPVTVRVPPGLPSTLLERRPDIAAAERSMAAANARIGVAKAAFFPSLTLTGAGGFESATLGDLFKWSSRTFLLGPFAGTALNIPIFDGGRRKGNLANARAIYEEDAANYRQQVLVAFREVEDNLSDLRILEDQTATQSDAVKASVRAAQLSRTQYTEGAVNYLDVIDAERTVLQSQRTSVQLAGTQAVSTVNLIRALGGGWGDAMPAPVPEPSLAQK
ncbi:MULTISPECIES: efflux transporter outer membrane subunit [unclassified Caballeronia]|uniref:efflux transporter outer membrane subunit n=1 Tax=unclassified Caballeronia TaxID=2646786 RepID=UPI00285C64F3|nr:MULTISPECIES: efflux transporter outer membrane subunit [unclassified Caballeronia]MDR5775392.1 efflux transporter outer membrane subunit [Caballeronia sp. LZ002]MDR5850830.1 efflux transporter outer membrane subunit [Caballeronia sp. LZ003]